jgi:hypothetical protein
MSNGSMNAAREPLKGRPRLSLAAGRQPDAAPLLLRRAIATRTCISATYNRGRVKLAPYVLYERGGALFVDAVTVERNGRPPRETKLAAFRLSGLGDLRPTAEAFAPQLEVETESDRYGGGILVRL